jgi:fucokinase
MAPHTHAKPAAWDYLIVTASNARQAAAYETQLNLRRELGLLAGVRNILVVADPPGRRIGSGGSTVLCVLEVLHRESRGQAAPCPDAQLWRDILQRLRILIVHGGGDSRRLPAYGPCGKIFVPVPGESDSTIGLTLFDRQLPTYLALPPTPSGAGQVVVTAGDVLLHFDSSEVRFAETGVTGLGCFAPPEQASRHGVFCAGADGRVRLFLQKPTPAQQADRGATDRYGRSILDIGVMSFDAATAVAMLQMCGAAPGADGRFVWTGRVGDAIEAKGLDFYCEICCAMGTDATPAHHAAGARAGGSRWDDTRLRQIFDALCAIPFRVQVLPRCEFMHFGTTRQVIGNGIDLLRAEQGISQSDTCLSIRNHVAPGGALVGTHAWVEACEIRAPLTLGGENVIVGLDVDEPLTLPSRACIDLMPGRSRGGGKVCFVRCYGVDDSFKDSDESRAGLHGRPIGEWLAAVGAKPEDVWEPQAPPGSRSIWDARLFPAEADPAAYRRWLWMFDPSSASAEQRAAWLAADRYSLAEIAEFADHDAFNERRTRLRAAEIRRSLRRMFRNESGFSGAELAHLLHHVEDRDGIVSELLSEARWHSTPDAVQPGPQSFVFSRILHTLGSAIARHDHDGRQPLARILPRLPETLSPADRAWLEMLGLEPHAGVTTNGWSERAKAIAFDYLGQTIVSSADRLPTHPVSSLRTDEIVWGRAPARLDLGGGWTDTPPYSLEHGGCVINAAVNLNGQPPIHCYGRVIREPLIRIGSIDLGTRVEVTELDDLLNYRAATSEFALAKAALALSGFSPQAAAWPAAISLRGMLERFGGGIELTTLAAVPKGSGLGTSSIVGAVILAVVQRLMGRALTWRELFSGVLRLEQALTTGGGWQDQIGGVVADVKVITTEPGLIPDARIHYVPSDVLDPRGNGGRTLLYYTGITRLAKNILQQVVGRYLDRDRAAMATLRQLHRLPPYVADAMARKDAAAFGGLIDAAWNLNKQLDPDSSNEAIETLLARVRPHIYGAKLLGAGGGGFLLMVCKSPDDARAAKEMLEAEPPNERARFFDFDISREGLAVTVC